MSLKILSLIHASLVFGLLVLSIFSYFYGVGFVSNFNIKGDVFIYIIPLLAMFGYFGSKYIFRKQLLTINTSDALALKMAKYQSASIIKYALIEGPAVLAFVIFMRDGYTLYFTIAVCLLLYLAFDRPTKTKLFQDVQLTPTEQKEIQN